MGMDTFCYEPEERQPRSITYWRRRFLALVVGLAILATVAWAFSGALDARSSPAASTGPGSHGPTSAGHGSSRHGSTGHGLAGHGSAGHGAHSAGSSAASGASGGSGGTASAAGASGTGAPQPNRGQNTAEPGSPQPCQPRDVVLSLSTRQASYAPGQLPEFDVDVVSTAARTCAFNIGPKFLALVITAHGKRIWSSADCVGGRGSLLTSLARGVPTVLPLSWDRETSAPRCTAASRRTRSGNFAAAASDGGVTSKPVTFTLG